MKKHWRLVTIMLFVLLLSPWQSFAEKLNVIGEEWNGSYTNDKNENVIITFEIDPVSDFAEGPGGYLFTYRIKYRYKGYGKDTLLHTGSALIQSVEENELSKPLTKGSPLLKAECNEGLFTFIMQPDFTKDLLPHTLIVKKSHEADKSLLNTDKIVGSYEGAAG